MKNKIGINVYNTSFYGYSPDCIILYSGKFFKSNDYFRVINFNYFGIYISKLYI